MNSDKSNKYETLYNIKLPELYLFVTDVMDDFGYSLYRTVREVENTRRIETWTHTSSDEQKAIVWIEVVKPSATIDPYLTTDVLRAMNDENVTRLFFFTNGGLSEDDKGVLEGSNHFIFTTEEIVETLVAIETRKTIKVVKKRKTVKVPSAMVLIKNFFKNANVKRKSVHLKTSAVPELVGQYVKLIRKILYEVDKVKDINDIPIEVKEKLKKVQYDLLPEMVKTPSYIFPYQFSSLRDILFNLVQVSIIYIGNFIDYESEDDLKQNRETIEDILKKLEDVDAKVSLFKSDMLYQAEKNSVKIILTSGVIIFISIVLLIVLKFGR